MVHKIGDMMFKGSNFFQFGKIQISFVIILYLQRLLKSVQFLADLSSNGTDAGRSTKQMLSIHQQISIFMYRKSAVSDNEHKT
jgi:hypothetical protein